MKRGEYESIVNVGNTFDYHFYDYHAKGQETKAGKGIGKRKGRILSRRDRKQQPINYTFSAGQFDK